MRRAADRDMERHHRSSKLLAFAKATVEADGPTPWISHVNIRDGTGGWRSESGMRERRRASERTRMARKKTEKRD